MNDLGGGRGAAAVTDAVDAGGAAAREGGGGALEAWGPDTAPVSTAPDGANFVRLPAPHATPVLALDLGTRMGWALRTPAGITSSSMSWAERRGETRGDRLLRFYRWLVAMNACGLGLIVYELVRGHGKGGVLAAHCYAQFEGLVLTFAARHRIPVRSVHTGTLKKAITGSGNADKDAMKRAIRGAGFPAYASDEVDAIAVLLWATGGARE